MATQKECPHCKDIFEGRTKYCSSQCKYRFNILKRDEEKRQCLSPFKKRNRSYFSMITGYKRAAGRGQGKRVGNMVRGAMSAMVNVTIEQWVPLTIENIEKHFSVPFYDPTGIRLGDGTFVKKDQIPSDLNLLINAQLLT